MGKLPGPEPVHATCGGVVQTCQIYSPTEFLRYIRPKDSFFYKKLQYVEYFFFNRWYVVHSTERGRKTLSQGIQDSEEDGKKWKKK